MEKNGISFDPARRGGFSLQAGFENVTRRLSQTELARRLAAFYAFFLEEKVTPRHAVFYLYAQLAALGALFPLSVGTGWRLLFLLLFALAAGKARE